MYAVSFREECFFWIYQINWLWQGLCLFLFLLVFAFSISRIPRGLWMREIFLRIQDNILHWLFMGCFCHRCGGRAYRAKNIIWSRILENFSIRLRTNCLLPRHFSYRCQLDVPLGYADHTCTWIYSVRNPNACGEQGCCDCGRQFGKGLKWWFRRLQLSFFWLQGVIPESLTGFRKYLYSGGNIVMPGCCNTNDRIGHRICL